MKKIHASIVINAPRETVWDTMLNDATYRQWTAPFHEGSYYKGSWEQGSKILFLGPDPKTGKEGGMVSMIAENRPHEYISIKHIGIINDGVEDTESEEAKKWAPAYENYTFTDKDGGTEVAVEMDIDAETEGKVDFEQMWHNALQKLKELAEK